MHLYLHRKFRLANYTIGKLYIDGKYFCDTLEDTDRGLDKSMSLLMLKVKKIWGKTAIPTGTYSITLKIQSPKYKYRNQYNFCNGFVPRLCDVPAYDGILMHIGNKPEDTDGCILVGENKVKGQVINSTVTFKKLYEKMQRADRQGETIDITVSPDAPQF